MSEAAAAPAAPEVEAAAAAAAPAAAPAAPAQPPAAPPAAEPPNTLFTAPPPPAAAPAAPEGTPEWLPEKYRVMGEDGKLDLIASGKKLSEGYAAAAKRIGTGDLPPESPDAYNFTPPEQFKDALDPTLERSFRERAHKAGLTQSQFELVMGEYFTMVPAVLDGAAKLSADEARAELSKVWSNPTELSANMTAVERAVALVPESLQQQVREKYATDPVFWQFAAAFGKEAREDSPPRQTGSGSTVTDVEALMRSEAYRNPKHADHERVSKQVADAFAKRFGDRPAFQ